MKIKEQIYKTCGCCGQRNGIEQEGSYGCDNCEKPIDDLLNSGNTKHADFLEVTVFKQGAEGSETKAYQFCSWACLLTKLPSLETNYFLTLPYLSFDQGVLPGQTVEDFFAAIKAFK